MPDNQKQIPPITDPLGRAWKQPSIDSICFDELNDYVLMNRMTFHQLQNFSKSIPSAIYAGKMWRGSDDGKTWFLHWWTDSTKPDHFTHNVIEIIITD